MTLCVALAMAAGGCVSSQAYVETGHDKADFRDLKPRNPPTQVLVVADFRVNGEPEPEVNLEVFNAVVRVLQGTHVLTPVSSDPGTVLTVTVDDTVDLDHAHHQGFITGLTEGLVGSVVKDDYHFAYTLKSRTGTLQTGLYRHALLTVQGNAAPPGYGQPHSPKEAFSIIVKESVLEFLSDIATVKNNDSLMLVPDTSDGK